MNNLEKFECGDCGCYFWVENRNTFECPNCKEKNTLPIGCIDGQRKESIFKD